MSDKNRIRFYQGHCGELIGKDTKGRSVASIWCVGGGCVVTGYKGRPLMILPTVEEAEQFIREKLLYPERFDLS
jgi:hypothetical protein